MIVSYTERFDKKKGEDFCRKKTENGDEASRIVANGLNSGLWGELRKGVSWADRKAKERDKGYEKMEERSSDGGRLIVKKGKKRFIFTVWGTNMTPAWDAGLCVSWNRPVNVGAWVTVTRESKRSTDPTQQVEITGSTCLSVPSVCESVSEFHIFSISRSDCVLYVHSFSLCSLSASLSSHKILHSLTPH